MVCRSTTGTLGVGGPLHSRTNGLPTLPFPYCVGGGPPTDDEGGFTATPCGGTMELALRAGVGGVPDREGVWQGPAAGCRAGPLGVAIGVGGAE